MRRPAGMLAVIEAITERIVSLPIYPKLTSEQIQVVVSAVYEGFRKDISVNQESLAIVRITRSTGENSKMMKELRFGLIGYGYWGPKVARNLNSLPHAMVTMVADIDASRLAQ